MNIEYNGQILLITTRYNGKSLFGIRTITNMQFHGSRQAS